jgi:hypothetical protein
MSDYQQPDVASLARDLYPPLRIREEADPQHPDSFDEGERILFDKPVFLTSYQESFNARWQKGEKSYGRLNPMYYYGGTEREASISFTLAAGTAREALQNLNQCAKLAKSVYGRYKKYPLNLSAAAEAADPLASRRPDFTMAGTRYFRVDLGSLIRDERAFISAFSFNINPDAGVHDITYVPGGGGLTEEQMLGLLDEEQIALLEERGAFDGGQFLGSAPPENPTKILPRQIDIQISIIFRHDYPLGFGGPRRLGHPNKWAENHTDPSRDWPHGTGPIGVEPYIEGTPNTEVHRNAAPNDVAAPFDPADIADQYGLTLDADGNLVSEEGDSLSDQQPDEDSPAMRAQRRAEARERARAARVRRHAEREAAAAGVAETPEDPPTPPRVPSADD